MKAERELTRDTGTGARCYDDALDLTPHYHRHTCTHFLHTAEGNTCVARPPYKQPRVLLYKLC